MVYLSEWSKQQQDALLNQDLPKYNDTACVDGPPLSERRIAIITTSGLHQRTDRVFTPGVGEYRIIPDDTNMDDLIMSHVSTNLIEQVLSRFKYCLPNRPFKRVVGK